MTVQKPRRKSREVVVGGVGIGGENPVRVQTMLNKDTLDIEACAKQAFECVEAGAELIRITVPTPKHAKALSEIREVIKTKYKTEVPLIADIHFSMPAALEALKHADKIRINPGNLLDKKTMDNSPSTKGWQTKSDGVVLSEQKNTSPAIAGTPQEENFLNYQSELNRIETELKPFIKELKKAKKPIRIGANHGSLSNRILERYGDTAEGMVESAMEYLRIFQKNDFNDIVVAMKASDPLVMIEANRLLVQKMDEEKMDYPLHLGVTEAGSGFDGRAKSVLGIGTLLLDGLGDTIRVSLTEDPQEEIPVCYSILQATQTRTTKTELISCPSCGRTQFDIQKITNQIKERLGNLKGVKIAIMGCIVNGLGEMGDADFGYVGAGPGKVNLYHKKALIKKGVAEEEAVDELVELVESNVSL